MRRFARDTIFVFFLVATLVMLGEYLGTKVRNDVSVKRDYLEHHSRDIKTLVMGHSFAQFGLNPHSLGNGTYNLGNIGRKLVQDVKILEKYSPSLDSLLTVIYPINMGDLDPGLSFTVDWVYYTKHFGIYPDDWWDRVKSQSLLLSGFFSRKFFNSEISVNSLGYTPMHIEWDGTWSEFHPRRCQITELETYIKQLAKLAQMCHKNNWRLIAIVCPLSDLYLQECTEELYADVHNIINQVQALYPLEFHDYSRDSCFRSNALYFDSNHLNHTGATLFAKRIKQDFRL